MFILFIVDRKHVGDIVAYIVVCQYGPSLF